MTDTALTHYNLATTHQNSHHLNKAIQHYRLAIGLNPNLIPAINNLGLCLRDKGEFGQAIKLYQQALKIAPNDVNINLNLGNIYYETHRFQLALNHYLLVKKLDPININVLINLGMIYSIIGQHRLSQTYLRRAIKLNPSNPSLHFQLGHAYLKDKQPQKAIKSYQQVIKLNSDFQFAQSSLFMAKRQICDWEKLDSINNYLNQTHNEDPWGSIVRSENPTVNLVSASHWSQELEKSVFNLKLKFPLTNPYPRHSPSKIKIAYLSDNFGSHPAGFMALEIFKHHHFHNFETYAYSYGRNDQSLCRQNLEISANHFVDINPMSDLEVANHIRENQINILVDLSGYTDGNRLQICALRPSPIQISWPEVLGSTGASFFDYSVVDQTLVPKSEQNTFSEKLIYLSGCSYLRQFPPLSKPTKFSRKKFNLPKNAFVFGVFHQMYKIESTVWQIWMNILKAVPNSVLWLWQQNNTGVKNFCRYAKLSGIDPQRLVFCPSLKPDEFLARLPLANLALDTFIYGGGITSYQTLAAGVPLITLYGTHMASRVTSDLLQKSNVSELIAYSPTDYQTLAIQLAQNSSQLSKIKAKLTQSTLKNTLFNNSQSIENLETAYQKMLK